MQKIRIFFTISYLSPIGGAEAQMTRIILKTKEMGGYEPLFLSCYPVDSNNQYIRKLRRNGIKVIIPPSTINSFIGLSRRLLLVCIPFLLPLYMIGKRLSLEKAWLRLKEAIEYYSELVIRHFVFYLLLSWQHRLYPGDLIHVHRQWGRPLTEVFWGIRHKLPIIFTDHRAHGDFEDYAQSFSPWEVKVLKEHCIITVLSESIKDKARKVFGEEAEIVIVPNWVDDPGEVKPAPAESCQEFLLGSVGRLTRIKGYDVLLRSLGLLKGKGIKLRCEIVGEGKERQNLENLAGNLGIEDMVEFKGALQEEEISSFMNRISVFILPSRAEAMSLVLLQAMAHGKSIIATRSGGTSDIVLHGETGILVESENPEALAEAILKLYKAPALALAMGRRGREIYLKKYSPRAIWPRWDKLYSEICWTKENSSGIESDLEEIQKYYHQHDKMVSSPFGGVSFFDETLFRKIFQRLGFALKGKRILDIGCGRALCVEYLKKQGCEYTGIDIVNYLGEKPLSFAFLLADGQLLPFKSQTFDMIFCIDAFEHFSQPQKAAGEFRRVLKRGGEIFLSVPNYSNVAGLVKLTLEKMGVYKRNTWAPFGGWEPQARENLVTPWRIKKIFSGAGFEEFQLIGYDKELLMGIFPWVTHRTMPEGITFRLQRWFPGWKALIVRLFPYLSAHTFWRIR